MSIDVILTRAVDDNASLASKLDADGLATLSLPLIEIVPEAGPHLRSIVSDLDRFEHIIFVSRNAVRHGLPLLEDFWPQWPAHLNWIAVGDATARELARFDIDALTPAQPDSEGLLSLAALQAIDDQRVLIVRGGDGRTLLGDELTARGARVTYLEAYRRRAVTLELPERELLAEGDATVVIYSEAALDSLAANLDTLGTDIEFPLVVPSARLAAAAAAKGADRLFQADSAYEDDVVRAVLASRS